MQESASKDRGVRGLIWASKVTIPQPQEDYVIKEVRNTIMALSYPAQSIAHVSHPLHLKTRWTGPRAGFGPKELESTGLEESAKYAKMMGETQYPETAIYVPEVHVRIPRTVKHRPGIPDTRYYSFGTANAARIAVSRLSGLCRARSPTLNHRLAPQYVLPAAYLDVLDAYFLIAPPPGALHQPIDPSMIVFAGGSAGAAAPQSVYVKAVEFDGMPHIWPLALPNLTQSAEIVRRWARACDQAASIAKVGVKRRCEVSIVSLGNMTEERMEIDGLTNVTAEESRRSIWKKIHDIDWQVHQGDGTTWPKLSKL